MTASGKDLARLPEFKALERVYGALKPLDPEGRRKVIEAVHTLLKISEGMKPAHGFQGPGERKAPKKSRRK